MTEEARAALAAELLADPVAAHAVIFKDDHADRTPPSHEEFINLLHSEEEYVLFECFRGYGKSTLCEEGVALLAASGQVRNCLIVGDSYLRAVDRLKRVQQIITTNPLIQYLFGDRVGEIAGDTWKENKIELKSGSVIWCIGAGQALRGAKHGIHRPDFLFVDDLENEENVATPDARKKLSDWYEGALIPALAPPGRRRIRVAATPLHPEALAEVLRKSPTYKKLFVPISYIDDQGVEQASWPDRFPLEVVHKEKARLLMAGKQRTWAQEYMMEAVDPATQLFKKETFKMSPMEHTWQPVYLAYDPARTAKGSSCMTGIVAASVVGRKIIVWEARGERFLPDQIIDDIFMMNEKYHPVAIGVEPTGLEEFIRQPLRQEQTRRGQLLPLRDLTPPRGKDNFIARLQPFFMAGDMVFAGNEEKFAECFAQLLAFPSGLKDIPNALAYLPEMRGGVPVYDGFSEANVYAPRIKHMGSYTLALNASAAGTTGVLFQFVSGTFYLVKDWVAEDLPEQVVPNILAEASLEINGKPFTVVVPPHHFEMRNSFGLVGSMRNRGQVNKGGDPLRGREILQLAIRTEKRGSPCLLVADPADWSRRALSGGFVWEPGKTNPKAGLYATLVEGLEAACARAAPQAASANQATAQLPDGTTYKTSMVEY